MATNPITPITRDSNIWSSALRPLLTDAMLTLINKSPTLRAQLNQLSDDISAPNSLVQRIDAATPAMPGSQYNARDNLLSIHMDDLTALTTGNKTFSAETRFVGILVHEMGHRLDDANLDRAASIRGVDGKDIEFANIMVHSEGVSAANSFIIRKELLQTQENNAGPEIYFPGEQYNGTPGVLTGLSAIDNSTAAWTAPDRLQVFSELGANYLANVLTSGGTPPGTLTNWQAQIDSSRAVRGLPASPPPQPNSIELVDVNNDGIIEFVKYRDFSNTCRREDYTTTAAGDHVTTQTTYSAGFDSPVASREVITTNAAGTVTTAALDANADGTIDRTTVSVDANHNGQAESVATTYQNGSADIVVTDEGQAAWARMADHYDSLGRLDTRTTTNDNGSSSVDDWDQANTSAAALTSTYTDAQGQRDLQVTTNDNGTYQVIDADQTNANSWATATTSYTSGWQPTSQQVANDNGSSYTVAWDYANAGAWTTQVDQFDAQGRLDTRTTVNDNGSTAVDDWDQANTSAAALTSTYTDAQGRRDLQVTTNDNGTYQVIDTDQTNANSWATATTSYTSGWQPDSQILQNDDGGTTVNDWDLTNSLSWSYTSISLDAQGRNDHQEIYNRDGSRQLSDWDQTNANATVALTTNNYDAQGRVSQQVVTNDNGSFQVTDNDLMNAQYWTTVTSNYNSSWQPDNQTIMNRDGSTMVNDWDLTREFNWSFSSTLIDAQGRTDYQSFTNDNGSRTVTDWDLTNGYGWSVATTDYDPAGRQTTRTTVADGGAVAQNWQWREWDENVADYGYVNQSRQVAVYRTETYTDFRYVTVRVPEYDFDDFGFTYISGYHTIQERQAYSATRQVLDHYDTVTDTVYEVTGYHLVHHADWALL